ncbi:hypothetical protein NIES37_01180 [Tolypothrix tenuis PCC 7101]|uniref:Uncharacterized protein n=1 Tax=Tolypothrix tenuis PCC 7101 TaxID=231146 RepID=A0A1Z4MS32_9CYAN|nr:hypothetical protein NIES37_01180 [Tolypothrix tenuis PCC 7101]BAZ73302.1 hypothetical protein NIES50_18660 [Aulosira laxa NIES-50]
MIIDRTAYEGDWEKEGGRGQGARGERVLLSHAEAQRRGGESQRISSQLPITHYPLPSPHSITLWKPTKRFMEL